MSVRICFIIALFLVFSGVVRGSKSEEYPEYRCIPDDINEMNKCTFDDVHLNKTHFRFIPFIAKLCDKKMCENPDVKRIRFRHSSIQLLGPELCFRVYPSVIELNLSELKLEMILEHALDNCKKISILKLNNNKLVSLPDDVFQHTINLEVLELKNNQLRKLHPDTFVTLTKLEELLLGDNQLTELSCDLFRFKPNLKEFQVESNEIFDLEYEAIIRRLPRLDIINYNNNHLSCKRASKMWKALEAKRITVLDTSERRKRYFPIEIINRNIECLPDISWAAAHYLSEKLEKQQHIEL
jgi:Leucine-rich repeat (LRR) protein